MVARGLCVCLAGQGWEGLATVYKVLPHSALPTAPGSHQSVFCHYGYAHWTFHVNGIVSDVAGVSGLLHGA